MLLRLARVHVLELYGPRVSANAAKDLKALDKNLAEAEADVKEGLLFSPRKSGEAL
jgi:hypothetical protein